MYVSVRDMTARRSKRVYVMFLSVIQRVAVWYNLSLKKF